MRIPFIALVMLGACGAGLADAAQAADVYVISNEAVHFAPGELREVFLGERQFAAGRRLVLLDNASLQKDFIDRVVGIDPAKYSTVWAKKGFREGINPPEMKAGDQAVIATVRATPGAIGYVSMVPSGVHVVDRY